MHTCREIEKERDVTAGELEYVRDWARNSDRFLQSHGTLERVFICIFSFDHHNKLFELGLVLLTQG